MFANRGWDVAAIGAAVVLGALMVATVSEPWRIALGLGAVALFLLAWLTLSRSAVEGNGPAIALTAALIVAAGVGTAADANFAIFQCIAFPLIWMLARGTREAIIANVVAALAVGIGFRLSISPEPEAVPSIALSVLLSLAFSIALGLWITRIATQSEKRQALISELEATRERLAAVSRDAGAIAERERLARDIHDTIAQDLTGLVMLAQQARGESDASRRNGLLEQLETAARDALSETRSLVAAGSPTSLDAGLPAALDRLAARFRRESGIAVTVECDEADLDRDSEVVVLRCTQEALSNVRRHSGASRVLVTLAGTTLVVGDDGHGIDPAAPTTGFGLSGMRDRLSLAGGRLDIATGASGTTLTMTLTKEAV